MVEGVSELFAVAGIGVVAFVGSTVFAEIDKKNIATLLNVVAFLAAAGIAIKVFVAGIDLVEEVLYRKRW